MTVQLIIDQAARLQEAVDRLSQPTQPESRSPPPPLAWARDMALRIDNAVTQEKARHKRRRAKPDRQPMPTWVHSMVGQMAVAIKDVEKRRDGSQKESAIVEPERPEAPNWLVETSARLEQASVSYASRLEIKEAKMPAQAPPEWLVEMAGDFDFAFETYAVAPAPIDPKELEIDISTPTWIIDAGRQLGTAVKRLGRRSRPPTVPIDTSHSQPYWIVDAASGLSEIIKNLQKSARPAVIDDPSYLWKTQTWYDLPGWGRDYYQRLNTAIRRYERRGRGLNSQRLEPEILAVPGWIIKAASALDRALGLVEEKWELEEVFEPGEADTWQERVLLGLQSDKSIEDLLNAAPRLVALRRRLKDPRPTRYHLDRNQLKAGQTFVFGLLQPKKIDERDTAGKRQVYFVDKGFGRARVNQRELRSVQWRVFDPTIGYPVVRASEISRGVDGFKAQQEEFYFRLDSSCNLGAEPLQAITEGEPRDVPWVNPQTGKTELVTFSRYLELEAEGKAGTSAEFQQKYNFND